jgi:hypothetical protein
VHDDGNDRKDQEQVNQESADMEEREAAEPKQNENHCENQKHVKPSFYLGFEIQASGNCRNP